MDLPVQLLLLLVLLGGASSSCTDPASAYRLTGIVCRITYPAALVLNEKTTQVIETAFQHARYPDMKGEKNFMFTGRLEYSLSNLEIHNLSIGGSEVELRANDRIAVSITNVSAIFRGTITYGYDTWLIDLGQSVDFEIETRIDLVVNPKLYCGKNDRVAADTSDCLLNFQKLHLILQGDREPGWLKKLFTDFVTFTVKFVVRSQICREINKLSNILGEFIQQTAEQFLSDGDIGMDISITAAPILTSNYIESYHRGLARYKGEKAAINGSRFQPEQLSEERMLYFWISDEVLEPLVKAAHQDGRLVCNITGEELRDLFKVDLSVAKPSFLSELLSSESATLRAWSVSLPRLRTTPQGTSVQGVAAVELSGASGGPALYFHVGVEVLVNASYAHKQLVLRASPSHVDIAKPPVSEGALQLQDGDLPYLQEAIGHIGIPKVISYLEPGLTTLMNRQGLDLFEIINPEVIPQQGYVVVQLDFGFPHHLLTEFLKKTLE